MSAIRLANISRFSTEVTVIDAPAEANGTLKRLDVQTDQISILQYDKSFATLIGTSPEHSLLLSSGKTKNPFFHEACVFLPEQDELYTTSNLLQSTNTANFATILISRVKLLRSEQIQSESHIHTVEWAKLRPPQGIDMPNGGVNYKDGIIFCAQGSDKIGTGGLYYMPRKTPPKALVTNFHGREFNSVNDVVVSKDGCIWFTDPTYGYEQDYRPQPKLPNHVYRFNPETGDLRVVADDMKMPNGLCFSPKEDVLYVTDTDMIHADGDVFKKNLTRPATIYAYDVIQRAGSPFLANRRVFAYAADGVPDGIKCDVHGNVYSGCGDGVEVWNTGGSLIGIIMVPGGVANFCFGKAGEMFICAETELWRLQLASTTKGALLGI